jgi:hypothetical protein
VVWGGKGGQGAQLFNRVGFAHGIDLGIHALVIQRGEQLGMVADVGQTTEQQRFVLLHRRRTRRRHVGGSFYFEAVLLFFLSKQKTSLLLKQ